MSVVEGSIGTEGPPLDKLFALPNRTVTGKTVIAILKSILQTGESGYVSYATQLLLHYGSPDQLNIVKWIQPLHQYRTVGSPLNHYFNTFVPYSSLTI